LKALLGVEVFGKYFAGSNDESETRLASPVELLHYLDTLLDDYLSDQDAHIDKTQPHMYGLLRRFTVPPLLCDAKFLL
jgi:hypothetical protein